MHSRHRAVALCLLIQNKRDSDMIQVWHFDIMGQSIPVSPYLFFNGIALILGLLLFEKNLQKYHPAEEKKIYLIFVGGIFFAWLGAHTLDCIVRDLPFSEGGFTFLGGLISGTFFVLFFLLALVGPSKIGSVISCAIVPLILSHAIGRLGCFFGGCCYGKPLEIEGTFSFIHRHPTQLYESFFLVFLATFLVFSNKIHRRWYYLIYLYGYSFFRFIVEFLRGDDRGYFYGLSTSQFISAIVIVTISIFLISQNTCFQVIETIQNQIRYLQLPEMKNKIYHITIAFTRWREARRR